MMKKFLWGLVIIIGLVVVVAPLVKASELDDKQKEIEELEQKISQLQGEQKTLGSTISYLNAKISKTQVQIQKTNLELAQLESDIATLSGQIAVLDVSLEQLTQALVGRIQAIYKHENTNNSLVLLFSSAGLNDFFGRLRYLRLIQEHDRRVITDTERVRTDFDIQKQVKEQKQAEVESLKARLEKEKVTLARQQAEKNQLLAETKNSEKVYQSLLSKAVAELAAIQGIIAGRGTETKVKEVNEGEKVASIIPSASACSTGAHLHFEVAKNGAHQNPFSYLSGKSLIWDNADPEQNGTGSWPWPMNDPIRITQGYGQTSYSARYAGNIHTGVDMTGTNYEVKAVKKGTMYRGGIGCGGGTLQYVHVEQDNGEHTYYLHVNYI